MPSISVIISDMNPQIPSPQPSGEQPRNPESAGSPDTSPLPTLPEQPGIPGAPAPVVPQLTATDVAAAIAQMPSGPAAPPPTTSPAAAADQDVIEPEWVDQAEAIIDHTAGDPHAEEAAVEALQVDYLAKRYNHQVKNPDENV